MVGRAGGEPRFASFHMTKLDGTDAAPPLLNLQASFASGGKAHVSVPAERMLPSERWLLLSAGWRVRMTWRGTTSGRCCWRCR